MNDFQNISVKEKNKKILKTISLNMLFVSTCLAHSLFLVWCYKTKDYVLVYHNSFYGDEAKIISFGILCVTLTLFIYFVLYSINKLKNINERNKFYKEIISYKNLICFNCLNAFNAKQSGNIICNKCGSDLIEDINGFFERHPEKITEDKDIIVTEEIERELLKSQIVFTLLAAIFIPFIFVFVFIKLLG